MSNSRGVKRKQQASQPETAGDPAPNDQTEQIARRAKLDVTKGTECSCLSGPLPPHIRGAIMSGEISHLASLLRAYHTALLSASSTSANAAVDALLPLHSTDAIVVFPNSPAPASTIDAMSVLYEFHLSLNNAYKGACFPIPPSSSPAAEAGAGVGTGSAAAARAGDKGKAKAKPVAVGKGRKRIETEAAASTGAGARAAAEITTSAGGGGSGEGEGGQPMIEFEIQEIVPMAPDWAFARCEFRQSPAVTAAVTAAAEAGALEMSEAGGVETGRDDGDEGGKKVWGMFILRKLSLGVNEKMGGWRIARIIFTLAGQG